MSSLLPNLCVLGASLVLLFGLAVLWRRSPGAHIRAFRAQSMTLAGLIGAIGFSVGSSELYVVGALLLAIKGILMPRVLSRTNERLGGEIIDSYLNTATSILIAGALVLLAYVISAPLVALSRLPTRTGLPLAMGLIFVSLFVIVSRRRALTQVIGFLMLENGIALLAVLGAYGVPLIVELGVFLDALMGFLVMQIVVYQIHETFETMDVEQLSRLKH
jgi:hydrogenase-4 component E